jgi:hypothetical protein
MAGSAGPKPTNAINQAIERLAFFRFGELRDHLLDLKSTLVSSVILI